MSKKLKYITDGYIHEIENYIYNDLSPLDHPYYSDPTNDFNEELVKEILKEGEEYTILEAPNDDVIITSFGRLINTVKIKQLSVRFSHSALHTYISTEKIDNKEIFLQQGWDYDAEKMLGYYRKYNWKHVPPHDYVE